MLPFTSNTWFLCVDVSADSAVAYSCEAVAAVAFEGTPLLFPSTVDAIVAFAVAYNDSADIYHNEDTGFRTMAHFSCMVVHSIFLAARSK